MFRWCASDVAFSSALQWCKDQPDNYKEWNYKDENCVTWKVVKADKTDRRSCLYDRDCGAKELFICEVRITRVVKIYI
jgi:hypothetical protein